MSANRKARMVRREAEIGRRKLDAGGNRAVDVCHGKATYSSKARAKEQAAIKTRLYGVPAFAYACPVCFSWHLTTQRPEDFRARQRGGR